MMRWGMLVAISCAAAIGACGTTGLAGHPDASDDPAHETVPDVETVCSDRDDDGFRDESCGGDDCNDSDPTIHPGADDVCLDGVDRDCDGVVDGPMLMGNELQVSYSSAGEHATAGIPLIWSGSSYIVQWRQGDRFFLSHIDPAATEFLRTIEPERLSSFDWSGSSSGHVWSGSDGIYFDVLSGTGGVIRAGVALATAEGHGCPCISLWTGEYFGLFWMHQDLERTDIVHALYSETGEELHGYYPVTPAGVGETSSMLFPDWTRTATSTSIVYSASLHDDPPDWGIFLVDVEDDAPGLPADQVRLTTDSVEPGLPSIVWTGSEYGLTWRRSVLEVINPRYFSRFDEDGERLQPDEQLEGCYNVAARLHWTGSSFAMLCVPPLGHDAVISLVLIEADGSDIRAFELTEISDESGRFSQHMIWSGSEFGMLWSDLRGEAGEVLFQRVGLCD